MNNIFYGKNRTLFLIIYLALVIFWLFFIFRNSLADGIESKAQSDRVTEFIEKIAQEIDPEAKVEPAAVRSTAHFAEFFILGALYYIGTFFIRSNKISLFIHSLALSLLTAMADETIQLFSDGRGAEVQDVWIDFSGALVAHVLLFAVYYSYRHFKTAR